MWKVDDRQDREGYIRKYKNIKSRAHGGCEISVFKYVKTPKSKKIKAVKVPAKLSPGEVARLLGA